MSSSAWLSRMKFEITNLENDPPPNVICYPRDDNLAQLEAFLKGPIDTPYEEGLFQLDITVPDKYPFEPPLIRFKTPIYHPNIDEGGRICASILKKGVNEEGWKPAMNLRNTLLSLQQLIGTPNPDDPLDADIAKEYIQDHDLFSKKAKEHTKKYATDSQEKQDSASSTSTQKNPDEHITMPTTEIDQANHMNPFLLNPSDPPDNTAVKPKAKLSLSRKKRSKSLSSSSTQLSSSQQPLEGKTVTQASIHKGHTLSQQSLEETSTHIQKQSSQQSVEQASTHIQQQSSQQSVKETYTHIQQQSSQQSVKETSTQRMIHEEGQAPSPQHSKNETSTQGRDQQESPQYPLKQTEAQASSHEKYQVSPPSQLVNMTIKTTEESRTKEMDQPMEQVTVEIIQNENEAPLPTAKKQDNVTTLETPFYKNSTYDDDIFSDIFPEEDVSKPLVKRKPNKISLSCKKKIKHT